MKEIYISIRGSGLLAAVVLSLHLFLLLLKFLVFFSLGFEGSLFLVDLLGEFLNLSNELRLLLEIAFILEFLLFVKIHHQGTVILVPGDRFLLVEGFLDKSLGYVHAWLGFFLSHTLTTMVWRLAGCWDSCLADLSSSKRSQLFFLYRTMKGVLLRLSNRGS